MDIVGSDPTEASVAIIAREALYLKTLNDPILKKRITPK